MAQTNPAPTAILPVARPRLEPERVRATLERHRHLIEPSERDQPVAVLALRGYYRDTMGAPGRNDRGLYDDAIFVIEPGGVHPFNANVDPSRVRHAMARLKAHQSVRYRPGWHGYSSANGHPAFRQDSPVIVLRDGIGEDSDAGKARFWINLHCGGRNHTSSAGCLTIPPGQWPGFKRLLDTLLKRHRQDTFRLVLLDARSVADSDNFQMRRTNPMPDTKDPLIALLTALASALQPAARATPISNPPAPDQGLEPDLAQAFERLALAIETARAGRSGLTPVNRAMGETLGRMLDGRKTGLGVVGLLASLILPALAVPFPALEPVADVLIRSGDIIVPVLSALTGWGILGKLDKWTALLANRPSST